MSGDEEGVAIWDALDRIIAPPAPESLPQGYRVERVPACGHMPHLEQPAIVARLIRDALTAAQP